jgi:hypothetical protein
MKIHILAFAALAAVLVGASSPLPAQEARPKPTLGIRGDRFTIDGKATFLLGISYYAGLGAPEAILREDLDRMQKYGFNWIRVWATWGAFGGDVSAVDVDGNPRPAGMDALKRILTECERRGMIVDVSLSRGNGVTGPKRLQTLASHQRAVTNLVKEFKGFRNWYLDLGNERNIMDVRFVSFEDLKTLRTLTKEIDPDRLVTASSAGDMPKEHVKAYLTDVGVDFLAPHRPRNAKSAAQTEAKSREYLGWTKDLGKVVPLHYQEPFRRGFGDYNPTLDDFRTDLEGARKGGAAGWCFHNGDERAKKDGQPRRSFDLRERGLFAQLDAVEQAFLTGFAEK